MSVVIICKGACWRLKGWIKMVCQACFLRAARFGCLHIMIHWMQAAYSLQILPMYAPPSENPSKHLLSPFFFLVEFLVRY